MSQIPKDIDDENEPESLSLSEYTFRQLSTIVEDPEAVKRLQPFLRQQDAVCCLNGESSYGELPMGLDWSIFRKAYTLLIWIKPEVSSTEENSKGPKKEKPWHQAPSSSNIMIVNEKDRRLWYRWSSHDCEDKDSRAGICVQSGPWKLAENNQLESTLTAFALPSSLHSMVQIPIRLPANEFSLVGFTHNFPYLKKPQWTVTVNGVLQGRGELKYPVVDATVNPYLASVVVLQNLGAGGVTQEVPASAADHTKPASELTTSPTESADQKLGLDFHVASMAFHADVIGPELQALMATTGGPSLSLQHGGKVATPLPPVENWTKGSSLEDGPNVGIPLAVHPLSLQVQHLQDKAIHYFGAASSSPKGNKRIVWTQTPLPGSFSSTPKVGLIQPAIPESIEKHNGSTPTLQFKGQVQLCHASSEYLMNSTSTHDSGFEIDFNPVDFSQQLSIVLQEQGLLTFLILPFFLAQLPAAGHDVDLQQSLQDQSLKMLYSLYTNDGAWAASLIDALSDCLENGGSRVHEQVLQNGLLHMLSSSLRRSLLRAQQKSIKSRKSLEECAGIEEESWWRPTHDESCPSWIPMPIAKACARLVLVACGGKRNGDVEDGTNNSLLTHWQRGSDLALSAIFGLALNLDLWGKQEEALLCMLSIVSSRYGTIAGGQLLRRQIPIQSFLDLTRSRLEFASPEVGNQLAVLLQHMLLASLSHSKNISIGEHDIHACCSALSDLPLGSVGTHVIFTSWMSILEWCNGDGSDSSMDEEHVLNVCKKLGRNLIMSQYHDVVAPMLLSRTVFCGERSMSMPDAISKGDGSTAASDAQQLYERHWQKHWRMALALFAWVTSIAGPEGVIAAKAAGALLLASGAAGSLEGCLINDETEDDETESLSYLHTLFLPPPTSALMMLGTSTASSNSTSSTATRDSWTYSDLLSDRLQVMMPLVPGFVMSLIPNPSLSLKLQPKPMSLLQELLEAIGASFHRVLGVLLSSSDISFGLTTRGRTGISREHQAIIKAGKDYSSPLVIIIAWMEYSLCLSGESAQLPVVLYQAPPPPKSPSDDDWVKTIHHTAFSEHQEDDVLDTQLGRTRKLHSLEVDELQDCQKCALSSVTDLLCQAMTHGGGETSTNLWQNIVNTLLQDAETCMRRATGDDKNKNTANPPGIITPAHVCRGVLCRLVAIVLTKILRRDHEFEVWSPILCESVARLMVMVEELQLLSYGGEDRNLLQGAILHVMAYGRQVTGWCQLILPKPPLPASRDFNGGPILSIEEQGEGEADLDRSPGASSKVLLPVLQPCLRVTMANLTSWESTTVVAEETTKMMPYLMQELRATLVAAIVGLSFPNARDVALLGLASIRQSLINEDKQALDDTTINSLKELSLELVEEITARYEGERRRREKALFDAYDDDDDEGEHETVKILEAQSSATVERLILGNDLVPPKEERTFETEEITFNDNGEKAKVQNNDISSSKSTTLRPPSDKDNDGTRSGTDDFVMFHDQQQYSNDLSQPNVDSNALESMLQGVKTQLGWDQYKGLGSVLEECSTLIKGTSKDTTDQTKMVMGLLLPFLDTWDANALLDQSELVELYNRKYCYTNNQPLNDDDHSTEEGANMSLRTSPSGSAAADAMSTYIEMASVEKSRLSEFVNSFLPAHRYSCQAYTERFCWSRYMEIFPSEIQLWERGIADGNRDIRSRLMTMPCNPQFKRFIPKNLDHSNQEEKRNDDVEKEDMVVALANEAEKNEEQQESVDENDSHEDDNDAALEELDSAEALPTMLNKSNSSLPSSTMMRRASSAKIDPSTLHQRLIESQSNLEIVDITKKENKNEDEAQSLVDPLLKDDEDDDDDIYGDGSLGFPSRDDDDDDDDSAKKPSSTTTTEDDDSSSSSSGITATRVLEAGTSGSQHHHFNIASSIYSHPPDNSSSILSLLHSSASSPALIEKHFDNCLHVKAEGSRKCTMLLSTTHLILEYDSESAGLFEGEMMAVREEAERQRLIEEAGGGSSKETNDEMESRIQEQLESRQKEIASLRPKSIRWNLSELSHVYLRRYRLRDSAIEMFYIPSGGSSFGGFGLYSPATSLFLDFGSGHDSHRRRDEAANAIMRRSPPQTIKQWPDKSNQFLHDQLSRLTMGWVEGRITNFDYLLHLNMLAGRSYNDLCQYPVMPWVLNDYKSEEIPDLTDRSNFRDLSKPVGALNEDRLNDFLERFSTFADPTIPPFMYGSHYSTSAGVVLHFLVRMHPFAGLHRQLQSGYFDVADRLFSSVPRTWDMCTGFSAAEVKELTPEWYCNPSFLKNTNKFKLGTSQDGEVLGDVILPPWADESPEKFVEVMRNALESRICSEMLPDWIDLIFGRKQQGPAAIDAHNVFFYLTYYGSVDVAAIEDEGLRQATELQIAHFGQCPMQLFVRPHVRRASAIPTRKLTFYQMLSAYTTTSVIITAEKKVMRRPSTSGNREITSMVTSRRPWKEVEHMPFFHSPSSHKISLDAPPPGPHAHLIAVRLAGIDRCLAVDANGTFHSFRWAWKSEIEAIGTTTENKKDLSFLMDSGNFVAQRELPRFRTVPRLFHSPLVASPNRPPAVAISKTLFASRSVLLVLSDGDGKGALAMQLVDPAKGTVKGEAVVPSVHSSKITSIAMAPIGTAAGHGGVGGELAIVGSSDGNASLWRFMSSHYLPLRPRIRMRGHYGHYVYAVALNPSIHICATVSKNQCCVFSIGNGAMIQSWPPPTNNILFENLPSNQTYKTVFCDTPALDISVQGYVVTVCETTIFDEQSTPIRSVITLQLYSLEGVSLGSKALESWRGTPHKVNCTPDGTAVAVCSSRGVTIHRLSSIEPLDFMDEWQIQASDDDVSEETAVWDVDFGPSLMRPIIAAAACSLGVLRLHALPGISAWSERHNKKSTLTDAGSRFMGRFKNTFGSGNTAKATSTVKEVSKEVKSEVKERGVGGFLSNTLFSRKSKR